MGHSVDSHIHCISIDRQGGQALFAVTATSSAPYFDVNFVRTTRYTPTN